MSTMIIEHGPFPFTGPVRGATEVPKAHGGTRWYDERQDGRRRARNVNAGAEEVGPWRAPGERL